MGILKEFKEFAIRGNMIDLAVGMIIGSAFTGLVNALVSDLIMPVISILTGRIDFSNMFIALDGNRYTTLADAQAVTSTISYGLFITEIINFLIMAFVIFMFVRGLNKLQKKPVEPESPAEKTCPYCKSTVDIGAARCPHCTSILSDELMEIAKKELA